MGTRVSCVYISWLKSSMSSLCNTQQCTFTVHPFLLVLYSIQFLRTTHMVIIMKAIDLQQTKEIGL